MAGWSPPFARKRRERKRARKLAQMRQRFEFAAHRMTLAMRGVSIAAVEARRSLEQARATGLFDVHDEEGEQNEPT